MSELVKDILSGDAQARLLAVLIVVSQAELNMRSLSLMLYGLKMTSADAGAERNLNAALTYAEQVIAAYGNSMSDLCAAMKDEREQPIPAHLH